MTRSVIRHVASTPHLAAEFADIWLNQPWLSTYHIAKRFGFGHRTAVSRAAAALRLPKRKQGPKAVVMTEDIRTQLIAGREARLPAKVLLHRLGLSAPTCYRMLRELGLPIRARQT